MVKRKDEKKKQKALKKKSNPEVRGDSEVSVDNEIKGYIFFGCIIILCLIPLFIAWIYLIN